MSYYHPDEFSLYDIGCMLLVTGLFLWVLSGLRYSFGWC